MQDEKCRPTARPWPAIIPELKPLRSSLVWRVGSTVIVPAIALTSKMWVTWLNTIRVENRDVLIKTIDKQYRDRTYPLLTISNHASCCDDPGLWGALFPWRWLFSAARHRWSAAAEDICFTKPWHTAFFSLGKTFPVVRGLGINQKGMDFAVDLIKEHQFLHIFPQGRVVEDPDLDLDIQSIRKLPLEEQINKVTLRDGDFDKPYQLKWGLARIILEYLHDPNNCKSSSDTKVTLAERRFVDVLPFFHIGMHYVLPNVEPYVPQVSCASYRLMNS